MLKYIKLKYKYSTYILLLLYVLLLNFTPTLFSFTFFFSDKKEQYFHSIPYNFLLVMILYCILVTIFHITYNKYTKIALFIIAFIYTVPNFIIINHLFNLHFDFNYYSMVILMETNFNESKDFISSYINLYYFIFSIFLVSLPFILIYFMQPLKKVNCKGICYPILLFLIISFIFFINLFSNNYVPHSRRPLINKELVIINFYKYLFDVYNDKKLLINELERLKQFNTTKDVDTSSLKNNEHTFIIVIGESASKSKYSLYGYNILTNPYLEKIKDELYIFNDVISPFGSTSESLENTFLYNNNSLINIFRSAGFKTYWISNQYQTGLFDAVPGAIGNSTDRAIFINDRTMYSGSDFQNKYDEDLLPILDDIINDEYDNKIIFIHLMGNHVKYKLRYPKTFEKIKSSKNHEYNQYLNSILYGDYILNEIIKKSEKLNHPSYVLFFSDHAEDVFISNKNKNRYHQSFNSTFPMYEIPFILYVNNEYKHNYHLMNKEEIINRPYQTNNLAHSIADISLLKHESILSEKSIFNKNFKKQKRLCEDVEYNNYYGTPVINNLDLLKRIKIFDNIKTPDNIKNLNFKNIFFEHELNTFERLNKFQLEFGGGIEIDLIYDNSTLMVAHDPKDISNNIDIYTYFKHVKNPSTKSFWFDIKNIDANNYKYIFNTLKTITTQYNIDESNVIIESSRTVHTKYYKENSNFILSYYFPYIRGKHNNQQIANIINNNIAKTESANFDVISFDIKYFAIIRHALPNMFYLSWAVHHPKGDYNKEKVWKDLIKHKFFEDSNSKALIFRNE